MPLCLYRTGDHGRARLGVIVNGAVIDSGAAGGPETLAEAFGMTAAALEERVHHVSRDTAGLPLDRLQLRAPIDRQEVWAAGVTYLRSRDARMEESQEKSVYDRVYEAERPELFMKGNSYRVSGPGEPVAVRGDSSWDVPEPECALAINTHGEIVGYTVGNDVSSRSIEGENPLYLPQAKVFDRCAALGPIIAMAWEVVNPAALPIRMMIRRGGETVFEAETSTSQMHRSFEDLVSHLLRHTTFPDGVFLMTGTGIVPPSEFTLEAGDEVEISIVGIGTLVNPVMRLH